MRPEDFISAEERGLYEAKRSEWIRGSVYDFKLTEVTDAASALRLISEISAQGEGLEEERPSHFTEFLELLDALEDGKLDVADLPTSPVARIAQAPDAGTAAPIITPYIKLWAELFDIRYNLLLLDLWHAMVTDRSLTARGALIDLAYVNMELIRQIATHLLQLREIMGAKDAAPPFGLMHDNFPKADALRWQRHRRLLLQQAEILQSIKLSPEFQEEGEVLDFDGNVTLQNLEMSDATRELLILTSIPT